jgi:hypothetical protein
MMTPPAIAMMSRITASIRSMQEGYPTQASSKLPGSRTWQLRSQDSLPVPSSSIRSAIDSTILEAR